jgi:hypothetical protein
MYRSVASIKRPAVGDRLEIGVEDREPEALTRGYTIVLGIRALRRPSVP